MPRRKVRHGMPCAVSVLYGHLLHFDVECGILVGNVHIVRCGAVLIAVRTDCGPVVGGHKHAIKVEGALHSYKSIRGADGRLQAAGVKVGYLLANFVGIEQLHVLVGQGKPAGRGGIVIAAVAGSFLNARESYYLKAAHADVAQNILEGDVTAVLRNIQRVLTFCIPLKSGCTGSAVIVLRNCDVVAQYQPPGLPDRSAVSCAKIDGKAIKQCHIVKSYGVIFI